jgi:hypothetical protein
MGDRSLARGHAAVRPSVQTPLLPQ